MMSARKDFDRGILTLALGKDLYFDMARTFALSARRSNPHIPLAVVSDREQSILNSVYDVIVPYREGWGEGYIRKLYANQYSPFRRTFYIDADMLILRNIDSYWADVEGTPFTCLARNVMVSGMATWPNTARHSGCRSCER